MPTTEEILSLARQLGQKIAEHDSSAALQTALDALEADTESKRAAADLNRHTDALAEKRSAGKPIEVEDKRKLETLQKQVMRSPTLGRVQMAQMDYLDLMRAVDDAITGQAPTTGSEVAGQADITP